MYATRVHSFRISLFSSFIMCLTNSLKNPQVFWNMNTAKLALYICFERKIRTTSIAEQPHVTREQLKKDGWTNSNIISNWRWRTMNTIVIQESELRVLIQLFILCYTKPSLYDYLFPRLQNRLVVIFISSTTNTITTVSQFS